MGAAKGNETGHWEPERLVACHDRILAALGSRWDDWRAVDRMKAKTEQIDGWTDELAHLIEEEYGSSSLFVLKDPRICRLLALYRDVLARNGITPRYVLPIRNPLAVARSLAARNGMSEPYAALLWLRHVLDAEAETRGSARSITNYDAFLLDWQPTVASLLEGSGRDWPVTMEEAAPAVDAFLSPELRHHETSADELDAAPGIPDLVKQAYRHFLALSGPADPTPAFGALDRIKETLDQSARQIGDATFLEMRTRESRLDAEIGDRDAQISDRDAELQSRAIRIEAAGVDIARLADSLASASEDIKDLQRRLDKAHGDSDALRSEVKAREHSEQMLSVKISELKDEHERDTLRIIEQKNIEIRQRNWIIEQHETALSKIRNSKAHKAAKAIVEPAEALATRLKSFVSLRIVPMASLARLSFALLMRPRSFARAVSARRVRTAASLLAKSPQQFIDVSETYFRRLRHRTGSLPLPTYLPTVTSMDRGQSVAGLVSILIVNFNGRHHFDELFASLSNNSYEKYEIIVVDNASTDGSVAFIRQRMPSAKIIELDVNVGFAEANNIGAEAARGEYICLLNNDTRVAPDFLSELVNCLKGDGRIAAAAPKLRFWAQFVSLDLDLEPGRELLLDVSALERSTPEYVKHFFLSGCSEPLRDGDLRLRKLSRSVRILVPFDAARGEIGLRVKSEGDGVSVAARAGSAEPKPFAIPADQWTTLQLDLTAANDSPSWIINNAGSEITNHGVVRDIGFSHPDDGAYDEPSFVDALCGCVTLIRRDALKNQPIFAGRFFAYYEDMDLSLRLRRSGFSLAYCPTSVVYHKHASSSGENSPFFRYYVNRNRILFYALHFAATFWLPRYDQARAELVHLKLAYSTPSASPDEAAFALRIDQLLADWEAFLPLIEQGRFYERNRHFPRIAIYDSFWNTLGGGEYHAGVIAEALQSHGVVDLVSETEFDIPTIERQFHLDLSECRRTLVPAVSLHHDPAVTQNYDIFINATFSSDLCNRAEKSAYILYFPYSLDGRREKDLAFLQTYDHFLGCADYVGLWCERRWKVKAETLYPSAQGNDALPGETTRKRKLILNVGRFFWQGHNKKQLELVHAFRRLVEEKRIHDEWQLVFAGQVEQGNQDYFDTVAAAATGLPVTFRPNIARSDLIDLYSEAAIYWHATGLNERLDLYPDRAEHFGITTVEAMRFGCVPVVINAGGQPEIVQDGVNGFLFADEPELIEKTTKLAALFGAADPTPYLALSHRAHARALDFSKENTQARIVEILDLKPLSARPALDIIQPAH